METFFSVLSTIFSKLVDHTLEISVLICLIFIVKLIVSRKLPPWWHYSLWLMLLVQMMTPIEFENRLNLFNFLPAFPEPHVLELIVDEPPVDAVFKSTTPLEEPSYSPVFWFLINKSAPVIWFAGSMILGICILFESMMFWRRIRRISIVTDKKVLRLLLECKRRMKINRTVDIIVTDNVMSPALFGYFRPRLLLPEGSLDRLTNEELSFAFMHELGHLKRHDIGVSWLIAILQIIYWFNPLVWLAFYNMRIDQESACDAAVLSRIRRSQSNEYAKAIVCFLEKLRVNCQLPSLAGILENKTQMKRRISKIVQYRKRSRKIEIASVVLLISAGFVSFTLTGVAKDKNVPPFVKLITEDISVEAKPVKAEIETAGVEIKSDAISVNRHEADREPLYLALGKSSNSSGTYKDVLMVLDEYDDLHVQSEMLLQNRDTSVNNTPPVAQDPPATYTQYLSSSPFAVYPKKTLEKQVVEEKQEAFETTGSRLKAPAVPIAKAPVLKETASGEELTRKVEKPTIAVSRNEKELVGSQQVLAREDFSNETELRSNADLDPVADTLEVDASPPVSIAEFKKNPIVSETVFEKNDAVYAVNTAPDTADSVTTIENKRLPNNEKKSSILTKESGNNDKSSPFQQEDLDTPPKVIRVFRPQYPLRAKRDEISGYIKLQFVVTKEGHAVDTTVIESYPEGVFDESALEAIESYRFRPGIKDGEAVDVRVSLPIKYQIT